MNGLLLVNKPSGMTSHDVVSRVRRLLKTKEVGHSGTLDPLATGLMVLLIGEATKLSSFVTEGDKSYLVGIKLGTVTDTLDVTGNVLEEKKVNSTPNEVLNAAIQLIGEFNLEIPLYSAKKIDGKKLFEYARDGQSVELPKKTMKFWDVQPISENHFHLNCSKGSFIRSWVKMLGDTLGCGAVMSSLNRTGSHHFKVTDALTLEQLEELGAEKAGMRLISLDRALPGIKGIRISGMDAILMKNGQISHSLRTQLISRFNPEKDEIIQIWPEEKGRLLALIGLEKGQGFKVKRVFNY